MSAPRNNEVIQPSEGRLFMDYLYISFTIVVAVIIGKFLVTSTAEEIVDFFENEEHILSCAFVIACLVFIGLYSTNFFYYRRHEFVRNHIEDWLRETRNLIFQFRRHFFYVKKFLGMFEPTTTTSKNYNKIFSFIFYLNVTLYAAWILTTMCFGIDPEFVLMDIVPYVILGLVELLTDGKSLESICGHVGYAFVHAGILLAHVRFTELSYISVNTGISVLILGVVWYFVNVPVKRDTKRRKRVSASKPSR